VEKHRKGPQGDIALDRKPLLHQDLGTSLPQNSLNLGFKKTSRTPASTKEKDTRYVTPLANVPLLDPSTSEGTRTILRWTFEVSEEVSLPSKGNVNRRLRSSVSGHTAHKRGPARGVRAFSFLSIDQEINNK
jgi:hypothetical protein